MWWAQKSPRRKRAGVDLLLTSEWPKVQPFVGGAALGLNMSNNLSMMFFFAPTNFRVGTWNMFEHFQHHIYLWLKHQMSIWSTDWVDHFWLETIPFCFGQACSCFNSLKARSEVQESDSVEMNL